MLRQDVQILSPAMEAEQKLVPPFHLRDVIVEHEGVLVVLLSVVGDVPEVAHVQTRYLGPSSSLKGIGQSEPVRPIAALDLTAEPLITLTGDDEFIEETG